MENLIGEKMGEGATAVVHALGERQVLKVFKAHMGDDAIEKEAKIGFILNQMALPIPKLIGKTCFQGRVALIYERVYGKLFAECLSQEDELQSYAHAFANLHKNIHQQVAGDLPQQSVFFEHQILGLKTVLGPTTDLLLSMLARLPEKSQLCHGDFHPFNIFSNEKGHTVIDWNDACCGNAILDVAWTYLSMQTPFIMHILDKQTASGAVYFSQAYLSEYCKLSGVQEEAVISCLPLAAARRFHSNMVNGDEREKIEYAWLWALLNESHPDASTFTRPTFPYVPVRQND